MNVNKIWHYTFAVTCLGIVGWSLKDKALSNKHLKVVAVLWDPFLIPGENGKYGGILWELLMFMKQAKNLTYTIVGCCDDAWWGGTCYDSDNCTGMVGVVNRHEADIALGLYHILGVFPEVGTIWL